jgi:NAD-dependent dihydropyrimidine dehydrogenase PreA subunit
MTHVVTDNCHLCRFTDCVAVCPVECFHADEERTYIDPDVLSADCQQPPGGLACCCEAAR